MTSPEPRMVLVASAATWIRQAKTSLAALEASCPGGELSPRLADARQYNPVAFGRLIEAMTALGDAGLGPPVAQELQDLAGLVPVDQALG